jgi:SSS family solute:Na+ symporter
MAGGLASVLMVGIAVEEAWRILLALGAGTGAVFMLRWFWWRINAWSEISAMIASLVLFTSFGSACYLIGIPEPESHIKLLVIAVSTILIWLLVTFITPPEPDKTLDAFYRKVHPGGPGWRPVAARNPSVRPDRDLGLSIVAALLATGIVYATIPGVGYVIFGHWSNAIGCGVVALVCAVLLMPLVGRLSQAGQAG